MTNATVATTSVVSAKATLPTNAGAGTPRLTVGIDLGDRHSHLCVLDSDGAILEQSRLQTTPAAFRQRFAAMPPARIA
ncbi:MAG: hypothetical protein ACK58T_04820, partial [Phycisphaerae bacterium]